MSVSALKNELKSQGAIEAAQDPNSSVTAQDAERVLIEESKKAGSAALQFDPNASPEEKAAQARSVFAPLHFLSCGIPKIDTQLAAKRY